MVAYRPVIHACFPFILADRSRAMPRRDTFSQQRLPVAASFFGPSIACLAYMSASVGSSSLMAVTHEITPCHTFAVQRHTRQVSN